MLVDTGTVASEEIVGADAFALLAPPTDGADIAAGTAIAVVTLEIDTDVTTGLKHAFALYFRNTAAVLTVLAVSALILSLISFYVSDRVAPFTRFKRKVMQKEKFKIDLKFLKNKNLIG